MKNLETFNLKLNLNLSYKYLNTLAKYWGINKEFADRKEIKRELENKLKYQSTYFVKGVLFLYSDQKVYLIPATAPSVQDSPNPSEIKSIGQVAKELKQGKLPLSLINIKGKTKTTDPIVARFIKKDNLGEKFDPVMSNLSDMGDHSMFAGHGSDSDSEDEFSQAELNLNESISQLELGKDTVMNLAKGLYDQISGVREKSSSSAGIFSRPGTPMPSNQEIKTEPEINTRPQITSNNFEKGLSKINLPEFKESDSKIWLSDCKFLLKLFKITDHQISIGLLLSKLSSHLQTAMKGELQKLKLENGSFKPTESLTVADFEGILAKLTRRTAFDLENILESLKLDPSKPSNFRELYWQIFEIIKEQLGESTENKIIELVTAKAFRKKLPRNIIANFNFRMSEVISVDLADLACTIFSLDNTQVNNLKSFGIFNPKANPNISAQYKNKPPQSNFLNKVDNHIKKNTQNGFYRPQNNSRGSSFNNQRGRNYQGSPGHHVRFPNRSGHSSGAPVRPNNYRCTHCGKSGHTANYCYIKQNASRGGFQRFQR